VQLIRQTDQLFQRGISCGETSAWSLNTKRGLQTEAQFREALLQQRLTEAELRQQLERQMIVSRVKFNVVTQRVVVTTGEQAWREYVDVLRAQAIIDWKALDVQRAYENGLERRATR
jgi:hypothetical protein